MHWTTVAGVAWFVSGITAVEVAYRRGKRWLPWAVIAVWSAVPLAWAAVVVVRAS